MNNIFEGIAITPYLFVFDKAIEKTTNINVNVFTNIGGINQYLYLLLL